MSVIIDGTTGIVAPNITDLSLTSGRVPFITTNGDITDSANLVFSGTTLTTTGLDNTGTTTFTNLTASTALALDASKNVVSVTNTGSGNNVLATSPTLVTPTLSGNLTLNDGTTNGVLFLNGSKVATSGSALTFDGTNFGLGTASPSGASGTTFAVNGGAGQTRIALKNTASGDGSSDGFQIVLLSDGVNVIYQNRESGYQSFEGNSVERMRISSDGTFRVKGAGTAGSSDAVQFSGSAPANSLVLDSSGNLGVGTSSPAAKLDVSGTVQSTVSGGNGIVKAVGQNIGLLQIVSETGSTYAQMSGFAGTLQLNVSTSSMPSGNGGQFVLNSSGNLGIGTTSPSAKLEVRDYIAGGGDNTIAILHNYSDTGGDSRFSGLTFRIGSDNGTSAIRAFRTNTATNYETNLTFWTNPSGATQTPVERMRLTSDGTFRVKGAGTAGSTDAVQFSGSAPANTLILDSSGNLGIGTSSLDLVGSTTTLTIDKSGGNGQLSLKANGTTLGRIFADYSTSELRIGNPTANPVTIFTNNNERMRIDSTGKVGIGTTAPTHGLHVTSTTSLEAVRNIFVPHSGVTGGYGATATNKIHIGSYLDLQHFSFTNAPAILFNASIKRSDFIGSGTGTGSNFNVIEPYYNLSSYSIISNVNGGISFNIGPWGGLNEVDLGSLESHASYKGGHDGNCFVIRSTGANGLNMRPDTGDSNNSARVFFVNSATAWAIMNNSSNLSFRSGATVGSDSGTQRMYIDTSGNVVTTGYLRTTSSIQTQDNVGAYYTTAFGKTGVLKNVATSLFTVTGDVNSVYSLLEINYVIEDPGTDLFTGRKVFRLFWNGGTFLLNLITSEDYGTAPTFTGSATGATATIRITFNSTSASYSVNVAVQNTPISASITNMAIAEA